jgi:hypothetical protein
MKSLEWDRDAVIADVRDSIWRYVSPSSRFGPYGVLIAAALLRWPEADALRLGELQFLLSDEVGEFLAAMPRLMRRLSTSSAREEQWTTERLLGPVQWNRTLSLRAATGSPLLYVTAPAGRVYQTAENELLVHVLDAVATAGRSSTWAGSRSEQRPAAMVRGRLSEALRWQQSRMLVAIERVRPTARSLARIKSGRSRQHYAPVLDAHSKLMSLVEQLDRQAIRKAVEQTALVTADDAILFELLTTFRVVEVLTAQGWRLRPFGLFAGSISTRGYHLDGRPLRLWYQSTPAGLRPGSRYRQVLEAHSFDRRYDPRPDLVLQWTDLAGHDRWLLVECKLRKPGARHAARAALADLLSYRRAFDAVLEDAGQPYGLGVAWGAGLSPAAGAEVVLCTPDTLSEAVPQIVM